MSVESDLLGLPKSYTHTDGKTYPVSLITGKIRGAFEQALVERARARVKKRHKELSRSEYLRELREIEDREDKGDFAFLSKGTITTVLTTEWGQRTSLQLIMADAPAEVIDDLVVNRVEVAIDLLKRSLKSSMARLKGNPTEPDVADVQLIASPS